MFERVLCHLTNNIIFHAGWIQNEVSCKMCVRWYIDGLKLVRISKFYILIQIDMNYVTELSLFSYLLEWEAKLNTW